ncbi:MAG: hypothetical protein KF894_29380 [Labilithrix sp.]|nr:hypothetical protein [Labilithrix sp.]
MLSTLGMLACGGSDTPEPETPITQLKRRASSDFECPREQVKTKSLDARTKVASGCGQTATYIYICNKCTDVAALVVTGIGVLEECDCTWALDSVRRPR